MIYIQPCPFSPLIDIATDSKKEKRKTKRVKKFAWLPVLINNKWYWNVYYLCVYVSESYSNKWVLKSKKIIKP